MLEGSLEAKILIISDCLSIAGQADGQILQGSHRELLLNALSRAGIRSDDYCLSVLCAQYPAGGFDYQRIPAAQRAQAESDFKDVIRKSKANVLIPLGEHALEFITGLSSIHKWHLSLLKSKIEFGARKVIPLLHPHSVFKSYGDSAYISFGALRIREEMDEPSLIIPERKFHLNPGFEKTMDFLKRCLKAEILSIDVETGNGIINTVGIALSPTEAIAIEVLPYNKDPEQYYKLWQMIRAVLESDIPKVAQNFIYDCQYLSKYGIYVKNIHHDTMWAMKFLHPEFDKGLDNVGRIYTRYPYWKDDGKSWNNIKNWQEHLEYNCKDTTGTLTAYFNQKRALESRKLDTLFYDFVMRFAEPIREMCTRGLKLNEGALHALREAVRRDADNHGHIINEICKERIGREINVRSPKQLQTALKEMGLKLPVKTNRKTGKSGETADKKALVKLRKKYKDEPILASLIELSKHNKQLSSYLDFDYDRQDKRVRYTLDGCGTETGRWSAYNDPWGRGFNPQTVPKRTRNIFVAESGKKLIQIDLSQAESRYVAWEAPEPKLMEMLSTGKDVHRYVAGQIYNKPPEIVNNKERQLGKKSGHAANYGVGPDTFAESCLVEMDLFLTRAEARRIIDTYFATFPGIRNRQLNIQKEIRRTKTLRTALGRERVFYDRIGDSLFREAYAYAPQSVIPDITNHLMLYLQMHCELLLQVHDSILIQVEDTRVHEVVARAREIKAWHPRIVLPGGELVIPIDVEVGEQWGSLKKI